MTTANSTETHLVVVQFEDVDSGYTWWSKPMTEDEASVCIKETTNGGHVSVADYDTAAACVCTECRNRRIEWDRILNNHR